MYRWNFSMNMLNHMVVQHRRLIKVWMGILQMKFNCNMFCVRIAHVRKK